MKLNEHLKVLSEKRLSVLEWNCLGLQYEVCGVLHTDEDVYACN